MFNSLTRQLEEFQPVHPGIPGVPGKEPEARVYSCGPTVYNYPHIGNMRAYVFADILGRTLSFKGYKLTHVINITDVGHLTDDADDGEDKMEKMARTAAKSIWDIAQHYTQAYWEDIKALNIRQPARWTIATEYVPQMIAFAEKIADKHCYELDSGLYFDVSTVADYGRLARAQTEDGEGRIEAVEGKRNAADFAIWRKTPRGEKRQMEWDSPWGKGAPGWHLECSVMSSEVLGFPFDIHTGGIDHREIHHPNEIAQNQAFCCGDKASGGLDLPANSGARVWMHNNFLVERSGKMSKSSGEFLRLQLLIDKGYHPLAYRMMCLQAHYRSELEFSWEGLGAALTRLKRMLIAIGQLKDRAGEGAVQAGPRFAPFLERFDASVSDDLNTAIALTVFEEVLALKKVDPAEKLAVLAEMDGVLGLGVLALEREDLRIKPKGIDIGQSEIEVVLEARKAARANKDFARSDALRDELATNGVDVMDGDPLGWEWKLA
ncbi:MAG: cysteine--tRNA ligase [Novosphingobium sp.]|uniref:cysteine--tRNA ligase n=1 Tax=Novosphingobium sp. TaxID=1874826 RepID=UPI003B9A6B8F